jgi:hypothetical protein
MYDRMFVRWTACPICGLPVPIIKGVHDECLAEFERREEMRNARWQDAIFNDGEAHEESGE